MLGLKVTLSESFFHTSGVNLPVFILLYSINNFTYSSYINIIFQMLALFHVIYVSIKWCAKGVITIKVFYLVLHLLVCFLIIAYKILRLKSKSPSDAISRLVFPKCFVIGNNYKWWWIMYVSFPWVPYKLLFLVCNGRLLAETVLLVFLFNFVFFTV